jgi:hypothetical protein
VQPHNLFMSVLVVLALVLALVLAGTGRACACFVPLASDICIPVRPYVCRPLLISTRPTLRRCDGENRTRRQLLLAYVRLRSGSVARFSTAVVVEVGNDAAAIGRIRSS